MDYLQISGILVGQIVLGFFADSLGRRKIQILDSIIMFLGTVLLTAVTSPSLNGWVIALAWSFFFYGFGVGGEYPTTSSIASEKAESSDSLRERRGRTVVLTFAMQGWGQFINVSALLILVLIFNSSGNPPYSAAATGAIYRTSYALMFPFLLYLIYFRVWRQRENANYERVKGELENVSDSKPKKKDGYDRGCVVRNDALHTVPYTAVLSQQLPCPVVLLLAPHGRYLLWLVCQRFWVLWRQGVYRRHCERGCWPQCRCADHLPVDPAADRCAAGTLFLVCTCASSHTLSFLAQFGYYGAAYLIDKKWYGRRVMQSVGFLMIFLCYLMIAIFYDTLTTPQYIGWYQFLFYFQAFWLQLGPNCTTFLVAAEVYPTVVRATGHGLSAASGKLGALVPEIIFNYVSNRTRFWISTWFNLAGLITTVLFLPGTVSVAVIITMSTAIVIVQTHMCALHRNERAGPA